MDKISGQRDGGRHASRWMSVVLELRHEPHPVRVPLRELQEEFHEGLHLCQYEGRQCSVAGKSNI